MQSPVQFLINKMNGLRRNEDATKNKAGIKKRNIKPIFLTKHSSYFVLSSLKSLTFAPLMSLQSLVIERSLSATHKLLIVNLSLHLFFLNIFLFKLFYQ